MRRSVRLLTAASRDVKRTLSDSGSRCISPSDMPLSSAAISTFNPQLKMEKRNPNEWTPLCSTRELSCALTLGSGQVFAWQKHPELYVNNSNGDYNKLPLKGGGYYVCVVPITEGIRALSYYFRLEVDADPLYEHWTTTSDRMTEIISRLRGLRIVRQDPVECLFSFICSSNNNIARIQGMVDKLKATYGDLIYKEEDEDCYFYAFPSVNTLATKCEEATLRTLGFGYRAAFIVKTAKQLQELGGASYLNDIRDGKNVRSKAKTKLTSNKLARDEQQEKTTLYHAYQDDLMVFTGVGRKVADCVARFSLEKMEAIPVDTHVWQIACRELDATLSERKSITPTVYRMVGDLFRTRFAPQAGWAHSVLFAADLSAFKPEVPGQEKKFPSKRKAITAAPNPKTTKRKTSRTVT